MIERTTPLAILTSSLAFLGIVTACGPPSAGNTIGDPSQLPSIRNVADVNETISLNTLETEQARLLGTYTLEVSNHGNRPVEFPPGFGAIGYEYRPNTDEWVEHGNSVRSPDVGVLLHDDSTEGGNKSVVYYYPQNQGAISNDHIWIVIVGTKLAPDGSSSEEVAAYTLVNLSMINSE